MGAVAVATSPRTRPATTSPDKIKTAIMELGLATQVPRGYVRKYLGPHRLRRATCPLFQQRCSRSGHRFPGGRAGLIQKNNLHALFGPGETVEQRGGSGCRLNRR